jgi:4-amino-4-deoxy-L-arabinose transferase-like glycosyltransferase
MSSAHRLRADRLALALSALAVLVTFWVTERIFEGIPHIEDEIAYVWQAQAIAAGHLTLPSPADPDSFLVPFVVDYGGQRFGKYPLGWPALLAVGVKLGLRALVNPLLAGLGVWLTYRLGKKLFGETVALLAALLTLTSPFFLMNSGSLLSHPFGLVLSAAFCLAWLDAFAGTATGPDAPRIRALAAWTAGLTLGALALTRPLTAVAVGLPFAVHGLYLLARGDGQTRRRVLGVGLLAVALGSLNFLWQYAVTGDPLLNPYTLWWEYDKIGFGPGIGRAENGHNLRIAWINTRHSLRSGYADLFGWGPFSWIFLPFGLLAVLLRRNGRALLVSAVIPSLVAVYLAYWVGAWLFGPRYYYEGLASLALLSAAGIAWLAGWPLDPGEAGRKAVGGAQAGGAQAIGTQAGVAQAGAARPTGWRRARALAVVAVVALLVAGNLVYYTPIRLGGMRGLYGMERADLEPFLTPEAQALAPALIVVHPERWMDYGVLLELEDPFLETPFIFIYSRGAASDEAVAEEFPGRAVYHYYPPGEAGKFYTGPR